MVQAKQAIHSNHAKPVHGLVSTVHGKVAAEYVPAIVQSNEVYFTTLILGDLLRKLLKTLLAHLARQDPRYWLTNA